MALERLQLGSGPAIPKFDTAHRVPRNDGTISFNTVRISVAGLAEVLTPTRRQSKLMFSPLLLCPYSFAPIYGPKRSPIFEDYCQNLQ